MRQEKQGQSKPGEKQSHCSLALTPGRLCWLVVCLRVGLDDRIRTGRVQFRRAVLRKSDVAEVMLNDGGPYDFVLDTAAQVTTIDPDLAGELHLKLLGETRVTGAGFQRAHRMHGCSCCRPAIIG